jgi:4-hydroxy-tetrahydrodipicolinate reductase
MKIALIGYGKMGQTIHRLMQQQGDEAALVIDFANRHELAAKHLGEADVAIEFTGPETAFGNVRTCLEAGVPVVCGSTGWVHRMDEVRAICEANRGAFFYASNYSIGVNIFFALSRYLSKLMATRPQYEVRIEEVHHTQKLDHPSGTAITLAEGILQNFTKKKTWEAHLQTTENEPFAPSENSLGILSKREGNVPGTHIVIWQSEVDTIEISHTAHSREGFAAGALAAAHWLVGRQGCFGMQDLIEL